MHINNPAQILLNYL